MSSGCAVIASDTAPVREVIDGENGSLVPFFDVATLAERVIEVLADPQRAKLMREKARQTVIDTYDAERICVPKVMALIRRASPRKAEPVPGLGEGHSNDLPDLQAAAEKAI
jgi:glycosyltransferase involved in cell wall biosynthesis